MYSGSFAATAKRLHACCLMNCPGMVAGSISYTCTKLTILQGGICSVSAVQHLLTVCHRCWPAVFASCQTTSAFETMLAYSKYIHIEFGNLWSHGVLTEQNCITALKAQMLLLSGGKQRSSSNSLPALHECQRACSADCNSVWNWSCLVTISQMLPVCTTEVSNHAICQI